MAWTTLLNAVFAIDKPAIGAHMIAFRDNLAAAMAGLFGAPVNAYAWHPYDMTAIGDGADGLIYSGTSVNTITTPDFEDGYEYRLIFSGLSASITTPRVRAYLETSAGYTAYGAYHDGETGPLWGSWDIIRPRVNSRMFAILQNSSRSVGGDGISTDEPGLRSIVTATTPQKLTRLQFNVSSGNFNGGQIYMQRRLAL